MNNQDFASCLTLLQQLNDDQSEIYKSFRKAMLKGGQDFASWLSSNGVPAGLATDLTKASGPDLAKLIGDEITEKFW